MPKEQATADPRQPVSPSGESARQRLIVALDFPSYQEAVHCVERLDGTCSWFKVGLELYLSAGAAMIDFLRQRGYSIFLDLKFHDIPNTVAGAVRAVGKLGVQLLTVHAGGGPAMLLAASEAAARLANPPTLLAVTVLTSMDRSELSATGVTQAPAEQVIRLARLAAANGVRGVVCSPDEIHSIRTALPEIVLVTPGIRPAGAAAGDQKRIATPAAALAAGSDYLVVGRPITQAEEPADAARAILDEMATAVK